MNHLTPLQHGEIAHLWLPPGTVVFDALPPSRRNFLLPEPDKLHQLGRYKWEKLGMDYKLRDAEPPSQEKIGQVLARFRAAGLNVV